MVYLHPDEPGVYIYLGFGFGFGFGFGLISCDSGRSTQPDSDYIEPSLAHISANTGTIPLYMVSMDRSH